MARLLPPSRYAVFILCAVLTVVAFGVGLMGEREGLFAAIPLAALVLLGLWDLTQPRHSIRRNYPIIGHIRWWVEAIRPELRQSLIGAARAGGRVPLARRAREGRFDPAPCAGPARLEQVKMIEIKLSQGAKPGHGGVLPAAKVTPEIAAIRGVPVGADCISPSRHTAFSTPIEMMQLIGRMRRASGGKPVGFKLC